jgi:transposase InsO family protein
MVSYIQTVPVKMLCNWSSTPRSVYYYQPSGNKPGRKPSTYTLKEDGSIVPNETVVSEIKKMLGHEFKSSYGYELTTIELQSLHYMINHKKVYRLMDENNLLLNKKISTLGKRQFAKFRTIEAAYPMEYLSMDIKYIWVQGEQRNYYLLSIEDVYSRKILSWIFKRSIRKKDIVDMLKRLHHKQNIKGVIIRNDNGPQFIAHVVRNFLRTVEVQQEFTHPGTPEENSYIEAFHSILQKLLCDKTEFSSYYDAKLALERFMKFYNEERWHRSIGFVTPEAKWQQGQALRSAVKQQNARVMLSRPDSEALSEESASYSLDNIQGEYLCLTAELKSAKENVNLNLNQLVKSVQFIGG